MNPENRWVKKAATIPWIEIEDRYAGLFPSKTGMPAKPLQTALGSLIIQKQYDYSDRELVEQIRENPYYQYFIGLPGYPVLHWEDQNLCAWKKRSRHTGITQTV